MTLSVYPASSGPGAAVLDNQWSGLGRLFAESGVVRTGRTNDDLNTGLDQLSVTHYGGAGMTLQVATGRALLKGVLLDVATDAYLLPAVTAADVTNPRKDLVVAYYRWVAPGAYTGGFRIIPGTPSGTPANPMTLLSAVDLVEWRIPLAGLTIPAGSTEVTQIDDLRDWCVLGSGPLAIARRLDNTFSIPPTGPTVIRFDESDSDYVDTDNMHSTITNNGERIVCTVPGWHHLEGVIAWSAPAGAAPVEYVGELLVNGIAVDMDRRPANSIAATNRMSTYFYLSRGDFVSLEASHASADAQTVQGVAGLGYRGTKLAVAWDRKGLS